MTTNSVYLPRRQLPVLPLVHPQQINLVGLKRLGGGTYGDCRRPSVWVKPLPPGRVATGVS